MPPQATSIDYAASGFLRHRFVRALSASLMVLTVFLCLFWLTTSFFALDIPQIDAATGAALVAAVAVVLVAMFVPLIALIGVASALIDKLDRRIVAIAVIAACLWLIQFCAFVLNGVIRAAPNPDMIRQINEAGIQTWQVWTSFGVMIGLVILAFELIAWGVWQVFATREGWRAARGWRPSGWKIFSTVFRCLGLPGFLAGFARGRWGLTFLYFLEALMNAGLICVLVVPFYLTGPNVGDQGLDTVIVTNIALASLFMLNIIGLGALIDRIADRSATQIYQRVRDWDGRAPVIFLRDFDQDRDRLRAHGIDPLVKLPAGVGASRTMDEILLEHASPYGPVIAIGDPRDTTPQLGAARVYVPNADLSWQNVVTSLVQASKAIVMCPTSSKGVAWELELLKSAGAEQRTIFLANPETPADETARLFAQAAPGAAAPPLARKQIAIAAYHDPQRGWRVLSARRQTVQTTTIALNIALQSMLGEEGVELIRNKSQAA